MNGQEQFRYVLNYLSHANCEHNSAFCGKENIKSALAQELDFHGCRSHRQSREHSRKAG